MLIDECILSKGEDITKEKLEIIKNNTCDYITFSYYMILTASTDSNAEITEGNTLRGLKIYIYSQVIGGGKLIH